MLDVLEHLTDPVAALRHATHLLTEQGVLVITVPAFQWLWTHHDDYNHHVRRYDRGSFRRLARQANVRIVRERYLFQWLVPAKIAVRAIEALRPGRSAPASVPSEPVNKILALLSRAEEYVSFLVSFPFGSSLMVIGSAMREPPAD
jgi:hypothetical protein